MTSFDLPDGAKVIKGSRGWELFRNDNFIRDLTFYEDQFIDAAIQAAITSKFCWNPISSAPESLSVDVWIKSKNNAEYGRRAVGICKIGDKWYGDGLPVESYGEYASHWKFSPGPPT